MPLSEKELQAAIKKGQTHRKSGVSSGIQRTANPYVNEALNNLEKQQVDTQTQQPEKKGFFGRTVERQKNILETAKGALGRQFSGEQSGIDTARQVGGKLAGQAAGTAFDALFSIAKNIGKALLPKSAEKKISDTTSSILDTKPAQKVLSAIEAGEEVYTTFKEKNPRLAAEVEAALGVAELSGLAPASKVISASKPLRVLSEASQAKKTAGALEKIEDVIKPTMTKKEVKRALEEGRVERANKLQKFLGKPDPVKAEKRVQDAAKTVLDEIPDAPYLDDTQIANKAKEQIKLIAESVEPKLSTIEFSPTVKEDILFSYLSKIEKNVGEYPLLSTAQVKRLNGNFEKVLLELGDANNADDLWKAIQKYDNDVLDTVKKANSQSNESLQIQKDIWLENRRILRDALDEIVEQADDDIVVEFKKMRDLYLVRENIINNAEFFKGSGNLSKALLRAGVAGGVGAAGTTAGFMLLD